MPLPSSDAPRWELERYLPLLRVMAWQLHLDRRLQRRFDSSDVVGEAMTRAVAGLKQFRGVTEAELIKWLQEILHNAFRDMVRREFAQQRSPNVEASVAAMVGESSARLDNFLATRQSSPSEQVEAQEVLLRWAAAVDGLPPEQREVVLLRDLHELPVKRIAEQLSCTEKAVAGRLLRGRQRLRESFPDYWSGGGRP
jgi:RNA polymerase sigma-70 factor (ECF subfamily)